LEGSAEDAAIRPSKRPRLPTFPECNCTVHLIRHVGSVVHVPTTDFCIGRDTKAVNLPLENDKFPNMVSRTHARIVSNDAGVHVIDCRSLNGTWLNGAKVAHHLLKSDDSLIIGNPNQGPPEFRFTVKMPSK
jgi:pSer/pThr/pTyr-binding forkhead associated (FHA) protein